MHLMGIGDEAGSTLDSQIRAAKELGWKFIEMRGVEVPGFAKDKDRKSTRLNSSHSQQSRMPSSA